jgi:hypothetical protein
MARARSAKWLYAPYLTHPAETYMNHEIDCMNDSRSELYANFDLSVTNAVGWPANSLSLSVCLCHALCFSQFTLYFSLTLCQTLILCFFFSCVSCTSVSVCFPLFRNFSRCLGKRFSFSPRNTRLQEVNC